MQIKCFHVLKSSIWPGPMGNERLHIQIWSVPNFIVPWSLHMSRPHFGQDQIFGTVCKANFGPDLGTIRIWFTFCKRGHNHYIILVGFPLSLSIQLHLRTGTYKSVL